MGNHHDDLARLASFFGGEEALNVVRALAQAGTTTDDVIATQANVRLNTARKVLYKLYDHALVTCVRSRTRRLAGSSITGSSSRTSWTRLYGAARRRL